MSFFSKNSYEQISVSENVCKNQIIFVLKVEMRLLTRRLQKVALLKFEESETKLSIMATWRMKHASTAFLSLDDTGRLPSIQK